MNNNYDGQSSLDDAPKMCRTGCCLVIITVLAAIGLTIDIYATQHGESDYVSRPTSSTTYEYVNVKVDITYRYDAFRTKVNYFEEWKRKQTISYDNATTEACDHDVSEYDEDYNYTDVCSSMRKLRDAGENTYILYSTAISVCSLALTLCVITMLVQHLCVSNPSHPCRKRMPFRWIISFLVFCALVFFLSAWSVFYSQYVSNLNDVLDYLIARYYPAVDATVDNWDDGKAGPSLSILLSCIILSFGTLITVSCFERDDFVGFFDSSPQYQNIDADDEGMGETTHTEGASSSSAAASSQNGQGDQQALIAGERELTAIDSQPNRFV